MGLFSSLDRNQKEAIGLLQIGTVLEYFDLMLYIHMAVLLNDLFFPKTDPRATNLLSAFAFCSTYVFRPFGALLFGYIGDNIGRKATVIITSTLMAVCCIIMANLPTYAQIGLTATLAITICRMLQGISSLGEIIGAEIYVTEITKPPERYVTVALVDAASCVGTFLALGVATLVTTIGLSWRLAFWIGALIAVVGVIARTKLRETPEFVDTQRRMRRAIEESSADGMQKAAEIFKKNSPIWREKTPWQTILAFFLIHCGWPVFMYFIYIYCGNILKANFNFTGEQVILQNFIVSLFSLLSVAFVGVLSYRIHPLEIVKARTFLLIPLVLAIPLLLYMATSSYYILFIQIACTLLALRDIPAAAVLIPHFPVLKRFTYASFIYAVAKALMHVLNAFGLVLLTNAFGHWGILILMLPAIIGFYWGIKYFERLEGETAMLNVKQPLSRLLRAQGLR